MTSQSSYTEPRRACSVGLLFNTLKRRWTTALMIAIIMFFALPLPIFMVFSANNDLPIDSLKSMVTEWSVVIRYVLVVMVSVLAVVIACVMQRYLHNKVSIDFFHSLPISRTRLLASQLTAGYILLIVPMLVMYLITLASIAANGAMSVETFRNSLSAIGESIIYSLLFYSLASLIGVVTGLTAVHLILTGVAIFIVPLIYVIVICFANVFSENMWLDWYLNDTVAAYLSPVLRFIFVNDTLSILEVVIFLVFTVAFFMLTGYFCLRFKSERAGNSVIFAPLGEAIKYILVFPMTIAGGLLFVYMMDSFFWMLFGMLCGGLLTFMLANTILNKSAKAMFSGLKGLLVYSAVVGISTIMIISNVGGINTNIPTADSLSKVEVKFDDSTQFMSFTDDKVMEALCTLYNENKPYFYNDTYSVETFSDSYYYMRTQSSQLELKLVYYPKVGIPYAKEITVYNKNELIDQLRTILDSDEFSEQYAEAFLSENISRWNMLRIETVYSFTLDGDNIEYNSTNVWNYERDTLNSAASGLKKAIEDDTQRVDFDFFQQTSLGYLRVYSKSNSNSLRSSGEYIYLPLSLRTSEVLSVFKNAGFTNIPADEFIKTFASTITKVIVHDIYNGDPIEFTEPEKIEEIISSLSLLGTDQYPSICQLSFVDQDYVVEYIQEIPIEYGENVIYDSSNDILYDSETGEIIEDNVISDHIKVRSMYGMFKYGCVPSFIG